MCEKEQKPKPEPEPWKKRAPQPEPHTWKPRAPELDRSHVHEKKSTGAGAMSFLRRLRSPG